MIAGRGGDDTFRPDLSQQVLNLVGGSPQLEGSGFLKVFQFQIDFCSAQMAEGWRIDQGGMDYFVSKDLHSPLDGRQ
jgi:hypothetical protein